jgi:hypothetical protein
MSVCGHLGYMDTTSHVGFQFSTHAAAGANVAPNSAFEAADLRIYRAAAGAAFSATQRSSASGITMTSPFDSLVGLHDVNIDLSDNTDAGFYAAGYRYSVVLAPDETVDGQTITAIQLAYFEIGDVVTDIVTEVVAALNDISAADVLTQVQTALTTAVADSVPADGTRPSIAQAAYMSTQFLLERSVSGTTLTVKKVDGSTTLFTVTLNDATTPTALTRAT